jgi:hypothetical protein
MMRASTRSTRGRSNETYSVSGFNHGPDPLPLGLFEPFRSKAEAGRKLPFVLNPLVQGVVGLHPFGIGISLSAVQQTGWLMAGFWSDAPHAPSPPGENPGVPGEARMRGDPPHGRRPQIHPNRLVPGPRPRIDLRNRFLRRPEFRNSREIFSRSNDNIRGREHDPLKQMLRNDEESSEGQVCGELTNGNDRTTILRAGQRELTTRTWELTTGTARGRQLRTQLF